MKETFDEWYARILKKNKDALDEKKEKRIEDFIKWIIDPLDDLPEWLTTSVVVILLILPMIPISILMRIYIWVRFPMRRGK